MSVLIGLNQRLQFGLGQPGNSGLIRGWYPPEEQKVWSDGASPAVALKLAHVPPGATLVVNASPKVPGQSTYLALGVFGNGLLIGWCRLDGAGVAVVTVPGAVARSVATTGELEVCFAIPDHATGQNGADRRKLGIALHSIELRK